MNYQPHSSYADSALALREAYETGKARREEKYRNETIARRKGYARESRRSALFYGLIGLALIVGGAVLVTLTPIGYAAGPIFGAGVGFLMSVMFPLASARKWDYWAQHPDLTP